jgi:hypothetical protein
MAHDVPVAISVTSVRSTMNKISWVSDAFKDVLNNDLLFSVKARKTGLSLDISLNSA